MSDSHSTLRQLHRIHRQLNDLTARFERGPKQIAIKQSALDDAQSAMDSHKATIQKMQMACDEQELELKEGEAAIESLQAKLNTCETNKEYQTLTDQIATTRKSNDSLSDVILAAIEEIESEHEKTSGLEATISDAGADLKRTQDSVSDQATQIQADIDRVTLERGEAEAALHEDFRPDYDRMVRLKNEDAIAQLEGNCCGNCFKTITPQMMAEIRMGKLVTCKTCGALLYPELNQVIE
ncbi:MAG: hypothetical protein MK006_07275 [Pirellulales bacterium]|nr:hypothetical protein [Pirellulales bacterium]